MSSIYIRIEGTNGIHISGVEAVREYFKKYRDKGFFIELIKHAGLDSFESEENIKDPNVNFNNIREYIKNRSIGEILKGLKKTEAPWIASFLKECFELINDEQGEEFIFKIIKWYRLADQFSHEMTEEEKEYIKKQLVLIRRRYENQIDRVYVINSDVYKLDEKGVVTKNEKKIAEGIKSFACGNEDNIIYLKEDGTLDDQTSDRAFKMWKNFGAPKLKQVAAARSDFLMLSEDNKVLEKDVDPDFPLTDVKAEYISVGLNTRSIIDESGTLRSNIPAINDMNKKNIMSIQAENRQSEKGDWCCSWLAMCKDGSYLYANCLPYDEISKSLPLGGDIIKAKLYNGYIYYIDKNNDVYKLDIAKGSKPDKIETFKCDDFYIINDIVKPI